MEMHASRPLAVSQQQAWEALNDAQTLKQCLNGCEKFELTEDGNYAVTMAVKVGPVSAKFNGKVTLSEIQPPESYTIAFEGQGGVAGFGKGQAKVALTPVDASHCELQYDVQAQVGGKIAQLGQRLIDGAAKNMADDFFARFEALMQERYPAAAASEVEAESSPEADARSWEHDAAASSHAPLDATPIAPPQEKAGVPAWAWALGAVVVVAALWLLSR
ncbi:carbon monoxide dehydrogenase [Comamonas testosteroni]|uniref:Carbon monoxide dehydrogenase n=1 Tax=Comamonas testosteroni TaxID=285 RepID=A0A373FPJ9_COMTE|nr:carbon monoxide dehydrogenase subunit G [Comamonas testosteroni]RGE46078.1 carbon monoxide dehydrogenase [Comamonas testosteroni]